MMESDPNENNSSGILQLSQLSLFEEDPYVEQISVLQQKQPEPINQAVHLLQAETLLHDKYCSVVVQGDSKTIKGEFYALISNYRVILINSPGSQSPQKTQGKSSLPISIPFGLMRQIDIVKRQVSIKLKTGPTFRIRPSAGDIHHIYQLFLKGYMMIPFFSKNILQQEDCVCYDCLAEIQRLRINWNYLIIVKNQNRELCPTYPHYFIVPKKIDQSLLQECLKLRNDSRIPVSTYYWNEAKSALWRAAKVKANQQNHKYNQAYIKQISRDLVTIDLNEEYSSRDPKSLKHINYSYRFMSILGLNNLFQKIVVNYAKDQELFRLLERWNQDISNIIKSAYQAVEEMKNGKQVLLQENYSLDRACQVAALAELIIDPYYRTINGFNILIEKEFVCFGHPFNYRMGFERQKPQEQSPIFIEFLQCVSQLIAAYPHCFQFSPFYLARLAYEAYTAKYNNFFFNDEELKKKYEYILRTLNIWKHLPMKKEYYNYQWKQKEALKPLICVRPMPSVKEYLIWRQFYDLITNLQSEERNQIHVKKRRSSIYKMFNTKNSPKKE